jgi:hypothetical protein
MLKKRDEPLVTREELEKVIDSIKELEPYRTFLKQRWVGMVMWWHRRAEKARWKYFLLRAIVIIGGVLIPVLSALSMFSGWERFFLVMISLVGAVVAGCAAWEGVANYGEIWREKRRAAELLKTEGWQFFERSGKYQNESYAAAFPRFAAEVEKMIAKEVGEYIAVFDTSLAQAKQTAAALAETITEEVKRQIGGQTKV